jgi:predicted Zn-dependent protease
MTLKQMSAEYQLSGDKCRNAIKILREKIRDAETSETERLLLRRQCLMLDDMAREAHATAAYLAGYYPKEETID